MSFFKKKKKPKYILDGGIYYFNKEHIHIGKGSTINTFGHLTAYPDAPIHIGEDTIIGPYIVINTGDHTYPETGPVRGQGHIKSSVSIGTGVWIGARVTVLRGSIIPDGCVIGACSLVTRHCKLEEYGIYAGIPVKKIGTRR
ncbi:MAG: acyltransferase [Deltaproteobacteria bacterium]|nr:acyltransferase [Deltaproteobacteria bacterium]